MYRLLFASSSMLLSLCPLGLAQEVDELYEVRLKTGTVTLTPLDGDISVVRISDPLDPTTTAALNEVLSALGPGETALWAMHGEGDDSYVEVQVSESTTSSSPTRHDVLINFRTLPSPAEMERLRQNGTSIGDYAGNNTYYATTTDHPTAIAEQDDNVRSVKPIDADSKIHPELRQELESAEASAAEASDTPIAVTVEVSDDVDLNTLAAWVEDLKGKVLEESAASSSATIVIDPAGVQELSTRQGVTLISRAPPEKQPFNDGVRSNIGAEIIAVAPYNLDGAGVKVGIWDGGVVAQSHSDFQGRLTIVEKAARISDHATHVAGTLGGDGTESGIAQEEQAVATLTLGLTLTEARAQPDDDSRSDEAAERVRTEQTISPFGAERQWRGIAPKTQLYSYFWDNAADDHKAAIEELGIQISQNSWGRTVDQSNCDFYGEYTTESRGYDRIITGLFGRRIPIVFANGNERNDEDCGMSAVRPYNNFRNITPPVTAKNIIAIGAINSDDDTMTEFSSWGPTDDGRIRPDVVTAGCERNGDQTVRSTLPNHKYGGMCGTSMAAPAASGALAIMLQQNARLGAGRELLPSSLKAALIHGASDVGKPGPDYQFGYGKIDLSSSVDLIRELKVTESEIERNGRVLAAELSVADRVEQLKVTLAWDDAPAATTALVSLVNDLDLQIVSPSQQSHQPWVLDPNDPGRPAQRGSDHRNVVEQVIIDSPEAGIWQILVRGFAVPLPPQPFSLVVTAR